MLKSYQMRLEKNPERALKIDNPETGGILDRSHRTKTNATPTTKQKRRETRTLQEERKKQKGSKKKISALEERKKST